MVLKRILAAFGARRSDAHLDAEIREHLARLTDDYVRRGLGAVDARAAARRDFGGVEQVKEAYRDQRRVLPFDVLALDARRATRALRKDATTTVACILTLALGIGGSSAIFSFVDGVMLKPLPYPDADRIVRLSELTPRGTRAPVSTMNYLDWAREGSPFEYVAAATGDYWVAWSDGGLPIKLLQAHVSARYFDVFGAHAALGRTFAPGDDQRGNDRVVVLSHGLWVSQFGADAAIIGRLIRLDGGAYTVIGVMPQGTAFDRSSAQMWAPLTFEPQYRTRDFRWLSVFAKVKPAETLTHAREQMAVLGGALAREFPDTNSGWSIATDLYRDGLVRGSVRQSLYLLLAAMTAVLLVGCANSGNLLLMRSAARTREVTIQIALGATRGRLVRQFLTESVLVSTVGGLLGVLGAYFAIAPLRAAVPVDMFPPEAVVAVDGRALAFALVVSVFTGIAFGLAPAFHGSAPPIANSRRSRRRLRNAFVSLEIALTFVLVASAGLLFRSFVNMRQFDTGFDSAHVVIADLPISEKRFADPAALNAYQRRIVDALGAVPGVTRVALATGHPLGGDLYVLPFRIAGRSSVDARRRPTCFVKIVSPSYFDAMGLRLRKGRVLTERDRGGAAFVTVVNETMARMYFSGGQPAGERVLVPEIIPGGVQLGKEIPWNVVGVVADERVTSLDDARDAPGIYVTNEQSPTPFQNVVVRTSLDARVLQEPLRKAVYAVDRDQPLTDIKAIDEIRSESMVSDRLRSALVSVFAGTALLLAGIGIYGVVASSVAQRTHEIGVRAALGASTRHLWGLVARDGLSMAALGLALGLAMAAGVARLLQSFLFGVSGWDPATMSVAAIAVLGVAAFAAALPTRAATRIDPIIALRED